MSTLNQHMWYFLGAFMCLCVSADVKVSVVSSPSEDEMKSCPYVYEARKPSAQDGLRNCTWYSSNACCKRTEVTSVFLGMLPLYTPDDMDTTKSRHCRNLLNYMMCYFCDPNQADWYNTTLKVCEQFCVDVYGNCSDASYDGKTIGEQFDNGEEFCKAQMFEVVPGESKCFNFDPSVFDSSTTLSASLITLAVPVLVALLCL